MGRHALADSRRRSPLAIAAGVVAAALFVVGADSYPHTVDVAAPKPPSPPPVTARPVAFKPAPPPPPPVLPHGVAPENGLQVKTILAARSVGAAFPEILDIGGVRADPLKWHPHGLAIDVMIPNSRSEAGKALGDSVVAYVLQNAERFGLHHVIWRQTFYRPDGTKKMMSDRGGDTANHYDHVHIATDGGGFPAEGQVYLR